MNGIRSVWCFLIGLVALSPHSVWSEGAPVSPEPAPISFATVDQALKLLHAKIGVTFREEGSWIVADDSAASTAWLITPPGHPAYPSIVRRMIVNTSTGAYMDTAVRCFAAKETCEQLFSGK